MYVSWARNASKTLAMTREGESPAVASEFVTKVTREGAQMEIISTAARSRRATLLGGTRPEMI